MNKFEKNIKDAVEGYEAPYSAEAWQSLNKAMGPSKAMLLKWVASSAAILTLAIIGYTYFDQPDAIITEELVAETIDNKDSKAFIKKVENSIYDADGKIINKEQPTEDTELNLIAEHTASTEPNTVEPNTVKPIIETQSNVELPVPNETVNNITSTDDNTTNPANNNVVFKASVIASNTTQCISNAFTFTPSVPKQNAIYEWHLGDGTITTASIVNHNYEVAGHYSVELVLRDIKTNEVIITSAPIEVTVLEAPITSFSDEQSVTIEPITYFKNTTPNYKSLVWEIENLKTSTLENFEYSFKNKGRFTVNLTATNENGCSTKTSKVITIEKDYNLLAPTAFSPNGDNLNDDFMPKALPLMQLPFTLTIYDRQGKLVYQTTDSSQPWDGINTQDGMPATSGVYVWVCQLTKENGETEIYQNQIIIAK